MIEIQGKYNRAKVFTDNIDEITKKQIKNYLDMDFSQGEKIRIMPDTHAGKGSVIGFTQTFTDKVAPNIVGVDIGCGMTTFILGKIDLDLNLLDQIIRRNIPSGFKVHKNIQEDFNQLEDLRAFDKLKDVPRLRRSLGSLGGGNHFIEANEDHEGIKYLVIHSGSRNLGTQIANYYQNLAIQIHQKDKNLAGKYPKDLCYLTGKNLQDYLHDMEITVEYARTNRDLMGKIILENYSRESGQKLKFNSFTTIHNYIDLEDRIIRKGAIRAHKDERVLTPLNMRDGSLICIGKGNPDWNYSAPHGAGRILSRRQAKKTIDLDDFKKSMEGIHTTSVSKSTLDEAPQTYKPAKEIIGAIGDTVEIERQIKVIYNYKDS